MTAVILHNRAKIPIKKPEKKLFSGILKSFTESFY